MEVSRVLTNIVLWFPLVFPASNETLRETEISTNEVLLECLLPLRNQKCTKCKVSSRCGCFPFGVRTVEKIYDCTNFTILNIHLYAKLQRIDLFKYMKICLRDERYVPFGKSEECQVLPRDASQSKCLYPNSSPEVVCRITLSRNVYIDFFQMQFIWTSIKYSHLFRTDEPRFKMKTMFKAVEYISTMEVYIHNDSNCPQSKSSTVPTAAVLNRKSTVIFNDVTQSEASSFHDGTTFQPEITSLLVNSTKSITGGSTFNKLIKSRYFIYGVSGFLILLFLTICIFCVWKIRKRRHGKLLRKSSFIYHSHLEFLPLSSYDNCASKERERGAYSKTVFPDNGKTTPERHSYLDQTPICRNIHYETKNLSKLVYEEIRDDNYIRSYERNKTFYLSSKKSFWTSLPSLNFLNSETSFKPDKVMWSRFKDCSLYKKKDSDIKFVEMKTLPSDSQPSSSINVNHTNFSSIADQPQMLQYIYSIPEDQKSRKSTTSEEDYAEINTPNETDASRDGSLKMTCDSTNEEIEVYNWIYSNNEQMTENAVYV